MRLALGLGLPYGVGVPGGLPAWLIRGPDNTFPIQQSEWVQGRGWYDGASYATISDYLTAASGTFSRASDATYFDADGVLQTAGPNVLRLDHDPATGDPLGFRAEGQRTNRVRGATAIGGVHWATGGTAPTVELEAGVAPDGQMTATQLTFVSQSGGEVGQVLSGSTGDNAISVFAQGVPGETLRIDLAGNPTPPSLVLTDQLARHFRTETSASAQKSFYLGTWGGQTVTECLVWGAQVELGGFSSSFVYTDESAATRLSDALAYWFSGTPEGSLIVRARTPLGTENNQVLWQWDDGSEDNRYRLVRDSDGDLHFVVTVEGSDEVDIDMGTVANDTGFTVAVSWKEGEFHASLNGGTAVSDTSYAGSLPTVTTMREGSSSAGEEWFGTIARMVLYDKAYSAEQVEAMAS